MKTKSQIFKAAFDQIDDAVSALDRDLPEVSLDALLITITIWFLKHQSSPEKIAAELDIIEWSVNEYKADYSRALTEILQCLDEMETREQKGFYV